MIRGRSNTTGKVRDYSLSYTRVNRARGTRVMKGKGYR